jgi:hypothetical protein
MLDDIAQLAGALASTLAPAIPLLTKAGDKALEQLRGAGIRGSWEHDDR